MCDYKEPQSNTLYIDSSSGIANYYLNTDTASSGWDYTPIGDQLPSWAKRHPYLQLQAEIDRLPSIPEPRKLYDWIPETYSIRFY